MYDHCRRQRGERAGHGAIEQVLDRIHGLEAEVEALKKKLEGPKVGPA